MSDQEILFALRVTARTSLLFFLAAFLARPLGRLQPGAFTAWLERSQFRSTLAFAVSHTVHLAAIIMLAASRGWERFLGEVGAVGLIGGSATYLFIYALATAAVLRHRMFWLTSAWFQ